MDPLSISAAVIGLLGSADAVTRKLSLLTRNAPSAFSIASTALVEVVSIQATLPRLSRYIEDGRASTREYIYLDQLSTLLTGCVKRFSELEGLLVGLPTVTEAESSRIDTARWAQNEQRVAAVVQRLQPYKLSLLLILEIIELQSIRENGQALERIQQSIDQLKDGLLSSDPELATLMSNATVLAASRDGSTSWSCTTRSDPNHSEGSSGVPPLSPTSPSWPEREMHSANDSERRQHGWRASWRSKQAKTGELIQGRTTRPPSVTTTSSSSARNTMFSSASRSSRISLANLDDISVYRLPISAEEISNGHRYMSLASETVKTVEPLTALREADDEDEIVESMIPLPPPAQHRVVLPVLSRPGTRMQSRQTTEAKKGTTVSLAEIEMSARKYQGYWRASFTAQMPAAAAICGCVLLANSSSIAGDQNLKTSEDTMENAHAVSELLAHAPSPAQLLREIRSCDLEDLVFALKGSLENSDIPVVPTKIAFSMYKAMEEVKDKPQKMLKAWEKVSKLLKKVPQETIVPLMFLLEMGRELRQRSLAVDGQPAGIFLMQSLWPQLGSKNLFALNSPAGDAASKLLTEHYLDIPDELPGILQAVNYRFESGSRADLMALLTTKRIRP